MLRPSFRADELLTLDEVLASHLGERSGPAALLLEDGAPVAGILASTSWPADIMLIDYLAVRPDWRGRGTGGTLVEQVTSRWSAVAGTKLVLAEVDDPRCHARDVNTGDPQARLRFYGRLGGRLLCTPHVQPALRPGSARVRGMLLMAFGAAAEPVPGQRLAAFLAHYFTACEGPAALDDPEVSGLLSWVRGRSGGIALVPPQRFADIPSLSEVLSRSG